MPGARAALPPPTPGQRLVSGRGLRITVDDVFADGRVWFRTDLHPPQAMLAPDFAAWARCIGARPDAPATTGLA